MSVFAIGLIDPVLQFVDADGVPYAAGTVTFYQSGTLTLQNVYSDHGLSVALPNPLPLNAGGYSSTSPTGSITGVYFLQHAYDYVLKDADGVTVYGPITFAGTPIGSSAVPSYTAKIANYTAVANDFVSATTNSFNVTLPSSAANPNATIWVVNNGTGTITLLPTGSNTIGLASSQTLNPSGSVSPAQGDSFVLVADGISNWNIV